VKEKARLKGLGHLGKVWGGGYTIPLYMRVVRETGYYP